jgi:hypothetical protein
MTMGEDRRPVRYSDQDKALLFDASERTGKRFVQQAKEVAAIPQSEWKPGWLNAYEEYGGFLREEARPLGPPSGILP